MNIFFLYLAGTLNSERKLKEKKFIVSDAISNKNTAFIPIKALCINYFIKRDHANFSVHMADQKGLS